MSRCLSMVSTAIMSIVCVCVVGGCALQGDEQNDPPASDPVTQDLSTPQLLTYFQSFNTDQFGQISLSGILDIRDYKEVDLEILQFPTNVPNMTVSVQMGKLSGSTLGASVGTFALNSATIIRKFAVVGPEVSLVFTGGPPNTTVGINAWIFLH